MKFSLTPEQDPHAPDGKVWYVRVLAQEEGYSVMYEYTEEFEFEIDARRFVRECGNDAVLDLTDWIEVEPLYDTINPY